MAFAAVKLDPPVKQQKGGKTIEYQLQYDKTNGDVRLIEYLVDGSPTRQAKPEVIFGPKDGNWNKISDPSITPNQLQQYKTQISQAIQGVAQRSNNKGNKPIVPTWATAAASPAPGAGSTAGGGLPGVPDFTIANLPRIIGQGIQALSDPLNVIGQTSSGNATVWGTANEAAADRTPLKYPSNMDESQDKLVIECFRYEPPYQSTFLNNTGQNAATILQAGVIRNSPLSAPVGGQIWLPMPNSVRDSSSVAWDVDAMNSLTMAASKVVGSNFVPLATALFGGNLIGAATGLGNLGSAALPAALNLYLGAAAATGAGKAGVSAAALSGLLGKFGYDVPADSLLARGAGVISNSNQELLFKGAAMRTFSFSYQLTPRSETEAVIVRKIIRRFKEFSAAKKNIGGSGSSGDVRGGPSFFLGTPNIWTLKYVTGDNVAIKGVNYIKPSALTRFEVDYTPQNTYMSDHQGNPMSYRISMDFSELEPIYNTDYSKDAFTKDLSNNTTIKRTDLRPTNGLDWIGY